MRMLGVLLIRQATPEPAGGTGGDGIGFVRNTFGVVWDRFVDLLKWVGGVSLNLVWAGVIVVVIIWITGRLRRRLRAELEVRTKGRNNLPALVDNVLQIGVYAFAAIIAFTALGADSSAFVQAAGLVTAAVSLSLQDVLKNFVAGIYLLAEEPFSEGDRLEVTGQVGTVERVNVRTTVLRNDKAEQVLVPNYEIFSKVVTNRTAYRLQTISIEVTGIKEDFKTVLANQDAWLAGMSGSETTPSRFELTKIGADGCDVTVTVWFTPGKDVRREVVQRLRDRFPDATLEIST